MNSAFDSVAKEYGQKSLVQVEGAASLWGLFSLKGNEDILDLGCGPGTLSQKWLEKTSGKVLGIDQSKEMISIAKQRNTDRLNFQKITAEDMNFQAQFDIVFCNSAFQWFKNQEKVVNNIYNALKSPGIIALQAPATKEFCPQFKKAVDYLYQTPYSPIINSFQNPWYLLENADDYSQLFEKACFKISYSQVHNQISKFTFEQLWGVFSTGAGAAYLNPQFYKADLPSNFKELFRKVFKQILFDEENEKPINLEFRRIFLVAEKA